MRCSHLSQWPRCWASRLPCTVLSTGMCPLAGYQSWLLLHAWTSHLWTGTLPSSLPFPGNHHSVLCFVGRSTEILHRNEGMWYISLLAPQRPPSVYFLIDVHLSLPGASPLSIGCLLPGVCHLFPQSLPIHTPLCQWVISTEQPPNVPGHRLQWGRFHNRSTILWEQASCVGMEVPRLYLAGVPTLRELRRN